MTRICFFKFLLVIQKFCTALRCRYGSFFPSYPKGVLALRQKENKMKRSNINKVNDEKLVDYRPLNMTSYNTESSKQEIISSSNKVFELLKEYTDKDQEHFLVILLNTRNALIEFKPIYIGTLDTCVFHPRDVFKYAIVNSCAKVIVAHNHPSGCLEPSTNDLLMTSRLKEAGQLLSIPVVDSVIISSEGFKSIV